MEILNDIFRNTEKLSLRLLGLYASIIRAQNRSGSPEQGVPLSSIAEELKTPLTALYGEIQVLIANGLVYSKLEYGQVMLFCRAFVNNSTDIMSNLFLKRKRKKENKETKEESFPHTPLKEESKETKENKEKEKDVYIFCARARDNNVNNNNIIRFVPPSVKEVAAYCAERHNGIDAEQFVAFYESKGWMIGKNKMKDWKAAIRTWEINNRKRGYAPVSDKFVHKPNSGFFD